MSKLRANPAKEVPKRVLMIACALTGVIVVLAMFLNFSLMWALIFFWLATLANLFAFRMIVIHSNVSLQKQEVGQKANILPNLITRYALYIAVLGAAFILGDMMSLIVSFFGVQLASIAIKLDVFLSGGD